MLEQNLTTDPFVAQNQNLAILGSEQNDLCSIAATNDSSLLLPYRDNLDSFDTVRKVADTSETSPTLRGNGKKDRLIGSNSNDKLYGLAGNDFLLGDRGDDILTGGTGKDILLGGQGSDLLVDDDDGGDLMTGNEDADIFSVGSWGKTENPNLITDFTIGSDRLKVGRLGATFENLTIQDSNEGAIVNDGDRQIAIIQGVKAESLQPDSFIFGDPALADRLQNALNQGQAENTTPGVTQAIITSEGFTWEGAAGLSNLADRTPTKPEDIFAINSTTKAFTAATVLKLTESGELSLDDTLDKWLPDIAANIPDGQDITVRQLLNGTSGIPDYASDEKFLTDVQANIASGTNKQFKPEELVEYIYGKPRFSGERSSPTWVYPNTGYVRSRQSSRKSIRSDRENDYR